MGFESRFLEKDWLLKPKTIIIVGTIMGWLWINYYCLWPPRSKNFLDTLALVSVWQLHHYCRDRVNSSTKQEADWSNWTWKMWLLVPLGMPLHQILIAIAYSTTIQWLNLNLNDGTPLRIYWHFSKTNPYKFHWPSTSWKS